jgi:response regulator RpfG family c-di-GMP phosphodiesterase
MHERIRSSFAFEAASVSHHRVPASSSSSITKPSNNAYANEPRKSVVRNRLQCSVLAKLAESRDVETGAHLERIRCYAREVASALVSNGEGEGPLSQKFVDHLFLSCPLPISEERWGIPDRILLKPAN